MGGGQPRRCSRHLDQKRVPLSSAQRVTRKGPFPYYGAQGVIDYIDDFIFDGRFVLVPEDGENLRSRKLPIAYFDRRAFLGQQSRAHH